MSTVNVRYLRIVVLIWTTAGFGISSCSLLRQNRDYIMIEDFKNISLSLLDVSDSVNGQIQYPCYIRVGCFRNKENTQPLATVEVFVLVRRENTSHDYSYYGWGNQYLGFRKGITGADGFVCVPTLCKTETLIFTQLEGQRLTTLPKYLPQRYFYRSQTRDEEIVISPRDRGMFLGKSGPVYHKSEFDMCNNATKDNSWYISFAYLSIPDSLMQTQPNPHLPLSWYYSRPQEPTFKSCFLKVLVRTSSYGVTITATSRNERNVLYGTYITGPKPRPGSSDTETRAACVEYRCPTDSKVTVNVTVSDAEFLCTSKSSPAPMKVLTEDNTFQLSLSPRDNLRPADGIYVAFKSVLLAKQMCTAGSADIESNFNANPSLNTFIEFSCQSPKSSPFG
ncbi:uncharacterized protein LOC125675380 isoform X1 [Ostrea edulis]|uniref:uncharacterized protein LOC125675380 isoform X1 n=1 Tax=Ostrea edulis TaxID=37623 RepID=UPI0024AFAE9F|nr:uncharacterized protein LOC125675380 isoform X1 [Ostrea edulis]